MYEFEWWYVVGMLAPVIALVLGFVAPRTWKGWGGDLRKIFFDDDKLGCLAVAGVLGAGWALLVVVESGDVLIQCLRGYAFMRGSSGWLFAGALLASLFMAFAMFIVCAWTFEVGCDGGASRCSRK